MPVDFRSASFGRSLARPSPYALLFWLLVLLLTVQGARLFWAIVTPVGPIGNWRPQTAQILPVPSRLALFGAFDPFYRAAPPAAAASITALNLTLFGVRVNEGAGGGGAIIAGPDGVQDSYAVGEEVQPGVFLFEVAFDHVVLDRGGVKESLFLDQSVPAQSVSPASSDPAAVPPPAAGQPAPPLTAETLQQGVGLAARVEDGRPSGIAVSPRGDGAIFAATGLRAGDVVVTLNGRPIASAADLASQMRPGARLSLGVERGSGTIPVNLILDNP